jgi:hypothetical protein
VITVRCKRNEKTADHIIGRWAWNGLNVVFSLIADGIGRRQLNSSVNEISYALELPDLHQNEGKPYTVLTYKLPNTICRYKSNSDGHSS